MDKPFIHEDARAEYVESYVWYHERGSHIVEAFEREVEHTRLSHCRIHPIVGLYMLEDSAEFC